MKIFAEPDEKELKRLLSEAGLPTLDIAPAMLGTFFGCRTDGGLDGAVGLEVYGTVALLRSLAVAPGKRGAGLGRALLRHAERQAVEGGVREVYLLTTTAERFFERAGYRRISREQIPPQIRETKEFSALCPESSAVMVKSVSAPAS